MVMGKGGFRRPIQLSTWLRDRLSDGRMVHALEVWGDYKASALAIPLVRGGKRKPISYQGFRTYLYVLRRLGLIEYLRTPEGEILTGEAADKGGNPAPQLARRRYFTIVLGKASSPAWGDPFGYLYPHLASQRHR